MGKHISISGVIEKYKISGSIARPLLRTLEKNGSIKNVDRHSRQALYAPTAAPVEKAPVVEKDAGKKGKKK